jgi:hypothetical protein
MRRNVWNTCDRMGINFMGSAMNIEGKKNLEFIKRALLSHLVNCSVKAIRDDDKKTNEIWHPEIEETEKMLEAVEINLEQFKGEETPSPCGHSPQVGSNTD